MKHLYYLLAAGLTLGPASLFGQVGRDFGANRYWLDDNNGHRLLLQFLGPVDGVVTFQSGNSTTLAGGTLSGQTLRWNGTVWTSASNLMNDGSNVTLTGQLSSQLVTGTAPFSVLSQTRVDNLNVDMIDGLHSGDLVQSSVSINTAAPLAGGGALTSDLNLSLNYDATLKVTAGLLGLDLSHANTWSAAQLLPAIPAQGDNLISAIGASALRIGTGNLATTVILESDIGTGLTVTGGVLSNTGVLAVNGTVGEIDASLLTGVVTLSLPAVISADLNGNAATATIAGNVSGVVQEDHGGTGISSYTAGDLIYSDAVNSLARLPIGGAGQLLHVSAGLPQWVTRNINTTAPLSGGGAFSGDLTLSLVVNSSLTTAGGVLGINLSNENTWLSTQHLPASASQGDNLINAIGASALRIGSSNLATTVILESDIGTGLTVTGGVLSNSGVLSVSGTTDEIDASTVAGAVTLSLPATINANTTGTSSNVTGVVLEDHGGTGTSTYTTGDMLYADAANSLAKLPIGTSGQVLSVSAGIPQWGSVPVVGPTKHSVYSGVVDLTSDPYVIPATITDGSTVVFITESLGGDPVVQLSDGSTPGQVLILVHADNTSHIHIHDELNIDITNPNFHFHQTGDNITLLWDGTHWIETSRSNLN